jgi:hypothetical protein
MIIVGYPWLSSEQNATEGSTLLLSNPRDWHQLKSTLQSEINPRKSIAKLFDAPVYKKIFRDTNAAISKFCETTAVKQIIKPYFVVEPTTDLIVCDTWSSFE